MALLAAAILTLSACRRAPARVSVLGESSPAGFVWSQSVPAAAGQLVLDSERREGFAGRPWSLATGGAAGRLIFSAGSPAAPADLRVWLSDRGAERELIHETIASGRWRDVEVTVPAGGAAALLHATLSGGDSRWGPTAFMPDKLDSPPPPNLLFILGDTVRLDAVGVYGAGPGRTPAIDELAAAGTRFAQARAQSSWTLPSVASLFTSRWCHEVTDWADWPQKIPLEATTLAEILKSRGYQTAAFSANVLVNWDNGYAQGFDTFFVPPMEVSLWTDALTLSDRVVPWLKAAQTRPFFAYVHFVDPHSPYCPPDKRPKDPKSPVPGDMSSAFYGKIPFPDAAEIARWRQLYAEEVALLDRGVARVLAALSPETRRRTYVIFIADHGEEFLEHGFLGHGWSLYDELLRVPVIVAGPGIPAGRVVPEPVGLVDLLPTLLARLGVTPDPGVAAGFRGMDLSRALAGEKLPAERTFLAETYRYGPMRLSVQRGMTQAIFFNRGPGKVEPVTNHLTGDARVAALLPRQALFDLVRDPGEKDNLAGKPESLAALSAAREVMLRSLPGALPGRWVVVRGPGAGGRITGRVRYGGAFDKIVPLFLCDGESLEAAGAEVRVSLNDDGTPRAWLVPDHAELEVVGAELSAEGAALPARGSTDRLPQGSGWATWKVDGTKGTATPAEIDEQVRRLKALGYLR